MNTTLKTRAAVPVRPTVQSPTVNDPKHPVQAEILKNIGDFTITATFEQDKQTLATFRHVYGLIAVICTLRTNGEIVGEGRGSAVLNRMNRYVERTVHSAFNSAFIDAVVRSTKMLDAIRVKANKDSGQIPLDTEPATEKQRDYLRQLIHMNIDEENERDQLDAQIADLTKVEASKMIESFRS